MSHRVEKVTALLTTLVAKALERFIETGTLVTVTNLRVTPNLAKAHVYLSILPDTKADETLSMINERKGEIRTEVAKKSVTKIVPDLVFEIDRGEKNRQRIDELLQDD